MKLTSDFSNAVLMLLGGARVYLPSLLSAKELGCKILVTDKNPSAECFKYADYSEAVDITDIEGSLSIARRYRVDGVVAMHDYAVKTAAAIAQDLGLAGIAPEVAERCTNKMLMRQKWSAAGVSCPRFEIVRSYKEALDAVDRLNSFPLIIKPADSRGGGSRGISVIGSRKEVEAALSYGQSFYDDPTVLIEDFIQGEGHSVETITFNGYTHVLAISDDVKTPLPYRVNRSLIYPSRLNKQRLSEIKEIAQKSVAALGISIGAAHVEIVTSPSGSFLLELGARCGGGGIPTPIVEFVTGVEFFKEVCRIALGGASKNLIPKTEKGCVYRFYMPKPGKVKRVLGLEAVKKWEGILDGDLSIGPGSTVGVVKNSRDRSGFIIAGAETREKALALADKAESEIQIEYACS